MISFVLRSTEAAYWYELWSNLPPLSAALCSVVDTKQLKNYYGNLKIIQHNELGKKELRIEVIYGEEKVWNVFHDMLHCTLYLKKQAYKVSWFGIRHGKQPFYVKLYKLLLFSSLLHLKFTVSLSRKRKAILNIELEIRI